MHADNGVADPGQRKIRGENSEVESEKVTLEIQLLNRVSAHSLSCTALYTKAGSPSHTAGQEWDGCWPQGRHLREVAGGLRLRQ